MKTKDQILNTGSKLISHYSKRPPTPQQTDHFREPFLRVHLIAGVTMSSVRAAQSGPQYHEHNKNHFSARSAYRLFASPFLLHSASLRYSVMLHRSAFARLCLAQYPGRGAVLVNQRRVFSLSARQVFAALFSLHFRPYLRGWLFFKSRDSHYLWTLPYDEVKENTSRCS